MLNFVAATVTIFIFATIAALIYAATVNPVGVFVLVCACLILVAFIWCFFIMKRLLSP